MVKHHYSTKQVFSRFNTAVAIVFSLVIIIAFALAAMRYYHELTKFELHSSQQLAEQTTILNQQFEQTIHTIRGLQEYANFTINNPNQLNKIPVPLAQDGKLFYLDVPQRDVINQRKQISVNITGIGSIAHISTEMRQELAMAYSLTPSFVVAQHSNPIATWFYYVSEHQFVSLYPWIGRQSWHYSDQITSEEYMNKVKKSSQQGQLYWTQAFQDTAGKGLMASIAAGVYHKKQFIGAILIDVNLALLKNMLLPIVSPKQGFILLDNNNHVLVEHSQSAHDIDINTKISDVLPVSLASKLTSIDSLNAQNSDIGDWLVSKQTLASNGWTLIQYQHDDDFIQPLLNDFMLLFVLLFLGLLSFIGFIYWLTRNTFIKPATAFIQHIEYCAQGDPGKIKPTADWLHWFKIVEDIFSQNRSLLQQLKDQNNILDQRVIEKTAELQQTSIKHQRDYALLRSVMNAIPELIIFSDPQGKLIGCNREVERYLAQSETAMYGQNASALMPERLGRALQQISTSAYQDEHANAYQNVVWANEQTFELYSCKFFNDQQHALGTINIFRDVTAQYETQSALELAKNQAESANKAKSQFLANMSHEIRTPINAIQGMMFLLSKTTLTTVQQQYLDNADVASKSLMYLIDELLDLSRIESGKISLTKTMVALDNVVEKALKLNIDHANKKHIEVVINIAENVPHSFICDEIRLVQVIANLLNNAVKFTNQGQVVLTISCTAQDNDKNNALVKFSVKDTGIGIAQDKQSQLFEAFTQADESMTRKYGGSGLGLSICKLLVNLFGGDITLKSELGQGSEFSFVLPLSHSQSWQQYLATQANHEYSDPVTVYSVGEPLADAVIHTLQIQHWHYQPLATVEELLTISVNQPAILIVKAATLLMDLSFLDSTAWRNISGQFAHIGICQPMMSEVNEQLGQWFDQHQLAWFIVEQPIYRALAKVLYAKMQPADLEPTTVIEHSVTPNQAKDLMGKTILLVEDNLVNQLVAKELLVSMHADVIIAENGQLALAALTQHSVDAVLMDIQMPVMDGLTAARKIRSQVQYADLPIIAMTAHAQEHDQQLSMDAGMNKHMAKPVSFEVLLATVLSVLPS